MNLGGTYSLDLQLFKELKLKPFSGNTHKEIFVGQYKLPHYEKAKIKIFVTCMPAQFWRFEVETDGGQNFEVETGSGLMSDFWPSVIKVAEGMLVIKDLS